MTVLTYVERSWAGSLTAKLSEQYERRAADLVRGDAEDYANYRERCGYLAALRDVQTLMNEATKEITS